MAENFMSNITLAVFRFNYVQYKLFQRIFQPNQSSPLLVRSGVEKQKDDASQVSQLGDSIVNKLRDMTKQFRDFTLQWARAVGKQQSPLIDRIPPRGVELWRDFWDTVRKQFRRINQEFLQLTRDMSRVLTGRQPSNPNNDQVFVRPREKRELKASKINGAEQKSLGNLFYSAVSSLTSEPDIQKQFAEYYESLSKKISEEQQKMDQIARASGQGMQQVDDNAANNLAEEFDDEQTRQVLKQNPGLRQQINQDINVFSSIFDIIRTFLTRLRGSAEEIRNMLERPGGMRDNNAVTPGPAIKPTVDQLLKDTIESQRNINTQARPTG